MAIAAEFLSNLFVDQFNKVNAAVQKQEEQETMLSKYFMHNASVWDSEMAPGVSDAFKEIIAAGMKQHDKLFKQAADLVVPLQHTIKIEPEP